MKNATFHSKVRSNYYTNLVTVTYGDNPVLFVEQTTVATKQFLIDAELYLIENCVPEQYAKKAVDYAWREGHAYGYEQVLFNLDDLLDIFRDEV